MSEYIASAPTAEQVAKEELEFSLICAGGDAPPVDIESSGADEAGYHFRQVMPQETWRIFHGLGRYPSVTVQSSAPAAALVEVEIIVTHESANRLRLRFMEPAEGVAWLR